LSGAVTTDVLIAGAGLAGSVAAHLLSRQGIKVVLVDSRAEYPDCFKAEKIEPDQAKLFRQFGLMDALRPHTGSIHEVLDAQHGRVLKVLNTEQYGIRYHDMVNEIRRRLPPAVDFRITRVTDISLTPELQTVTLADGATITARLVVMACGTGGSLSGHLGIERQVIRKEHSSAFGFDVVPTTTRRFPFQSITYYPNGWKSGIGYLTLFPIGDNMRANLFTFRPLTDPWSRELVKEPKQTLLRALPKLRELTGDFQVAGRVESSRIDLYRVSAPERDGLILMGDSFQSVCPTTGTGLSKVLTDAQVLCETCVPKWLSTPGMGRDKTAAWYRDQRKIDCDEKSLRSATYRRQVSIDGSLRWRVHRAKVLAEMLYSGWPKAFRVTKRLHSEV
jgi:2-polyprenyl-6-methoxyphenol hydroxylase-like FAD-dependent oxidoreductase